MSVDAITCVTMLSVQVCVCSCPHKNRSLKRKPAQVTKTAPRLFADRCIVGNAGSSSSSRLLDHDDVAEIFNPKMQKLHKSGRLARRCEVHKFRCCKRLLHEYFISISASLRLYSGKDSSCFFLNPFFGVISLLWPLMFNYGPWGPVAIDADVHLVSAGTLSLFFFEGTPTVLSFYPALTPQFFLNTGIS